jgi:hypothetical protein
VILVAFLQASRQDFLLGKLMTYSEELLVEEILLKISLVIMMMTFSVADLEVKVKRIVKEASKSREIHLASEVSVVDSVEDSMMTSSILDLIIWVDLVVVSNHHRFLLLAAREWDKVLRPRLLLKMGNG